MTQSMTPYRPGEVVLIPFPFTDFSTFKQRPAVVISSARFNRAHGDVVVVAITSHIPSRKLRDDYVVPESEQGRAGLPKPSIVKMGKIITLDQRLIRKIIGRFSNKATKEIVSHIKADIIREN